MSFTTEIKQEIANVELSDHCIRAQLSAIIQLTSSLTISSSGLGILVRSESPTTAKRIISLIKKEFDVETHLQVAKKTNLKKNNVYTVEIHHLASKIMTDLGIYNERGLQSHPSYEVIMRNCCAASYLAGVFLAYGSCNSPYSSNYHLEMSLSEIEHANFVVKLLSRFNISAKIVKRRSRYVVYVKKADYISDFLALIGAHTAMMQFEDERIERDFVNSNSRINNCEIANEVKTINASLKQVEYIEKIIQAGKYEKMPEKIRNVADLRMKYQDYSLLELCEAYQKNYGDVISKSGMKHRLNKIEEIAQELEE
ncbi:MAG: DNA-binding protein WhiA [Erysipelotrichaceae bacterium]|nr:DNA-binding protein WhiA [Erysipelotrichaceae bacterium]